MSRYGESYRKKSRKNQRGGNVYDIGAKARETVQNITEGSTVLQDFKRYANMLDEKRDRYEKLYKISRDITIESKRIIFLLHTIDRESKKASVLSEAETRLNTLISNSWKAIAKELKGENYYAYHRAFTFGMQEFLEAFIFYNYLKNFDIFNWEHYQNKLKYSDVDKPENSEMTEISGEIDIQKTLVNEMSLIVDPIDFILGLADVSGELMRKCTNNLGEGDVTGCFETCEFVKNLYTGFLGFFGTVPIKDISRKRITLQQNILKMEMICYNIQVRGSESLKYCLGDVESQEIYVDECNEYD